MTGLPVVGVAVTVTDEPFVSPAKSNVGVLSAVELSLEEVPKSEAEAKSGTEGTAMVVVRDTFDTAETPPAESRTTT